MSLDALAQIQAMPEGAFMRAAYQKVSARDRGQDPTKLVERVKELTVKTILGWRDLIPRQQWLSLPVNAYTPSNSWTIPGMQEMMGQILAQRSQNTLTFFSQIRKLMKVDEEVLARVDSQPTPREKTQAIHAWVEKILPTLSSEPPGSPLQYSPLARFLGVACASNAFGVAQKVIDSEHFQRITPWNLDLIVGPLVTEGNLAAAKLFINSRRFNEIGIGTLGMMLRLAVQEEDPVVETLLKNGNFFVYPGPPLLAIEHALEIAKTKSSERVVSQIQALYDEASRRSSLGG